MKDYMKRVAVERDELQVKIKKLGKFMSKQGKMRTLKDRPFEMMLDQLSLMTQYHNVLCMRLEEHERNEEDEDE